MDQLQPIKGTKDLIGEEYYTFEYIVDNAKKIAKSFNYQGLSTPIFENIKVFSKSLGEASDVVGKEMFDFVTKGQDHITLRPEFTSSICRAFISNKLNHSLPLRFFSYGPLFRYENPQAGRQRQFHQLNFEALGKESPFIDAEAIYCAATLLKNLDLLDETKLMINSLGCELTRANYRKVLVEYFSDYQQELSNDSQKRLNSNPLRILDSKNEHDQKIATNAPKIFNFFTNYSADFFAKVQEYLKVYQIEFNINHNLVRGLDYYNHTAFEFTSNNIGAQSAVIGGGRYNGLIKLLGGDDTSGVGFAAGIERIMLLLSKINKPNNQIGILLLDEKYLNYAMQFAITLRKQNFSTIFEPELKFDKALKRIVNNNTSYALFIGHDEFEKGQVKVKNLHTRVEILLNSDNLIPWIKNELY